MRIESINLYDYDHDKIDLDMQIGDFYPWTISVLFITGNMYLSYFK